MGSTLQVSCSCGFRIKEIAVGGGMLDFNDTCSAPALCRTCNRFLVLNLLNRYSCCPKCRGPVIYYNDPSLQEEVKGSDQESFPIFCWSMMPEREDFVLPKTKYYCPKCGKMNLEFQHVGDWD